MANKGKIYNISNRLGGARPVIVLAEDVEFKVNDSLAATIMIEAINDDEDKKDTDKAQEIVTVALGKDAADFLREQGASIIEWTEVLTAIMAAISNSDLDDIREVMEKND